MMTVTEAPATLIDEQKAEIARLEEQHALYAGRSSDYLAERLIIERQLEDADLDVDTMARLMARLPALSKLMGLNDKKAERLLEPLRFARESLKDMKAEIPKTRERLLEVERELPGARATEEDTRAEAERHANSPGWGDKAKRHHARSAAELRRLEEEAQRLKTRFTLLTGEAWQQQ